MGIIILCIIREKLFFHSLECFEVLDFNRTLETRHINIQESKADSNDKVLNIHANFMNVNDFHFTAKETLKDSAYIMIYILLESRFIT